MSDSIFEAWEDIQEQVWWKPTPCQLAAVILSSSIPDVDEHGVVVGEDVEGERPGREEHERLHQSVRLLEEPPPLKKWRWHHPTSLSNQIQIWDSLRLDRIEPLIKVTSSGVWYWSLQHWTRKMLITLSFLFSGGAFRLLMLEGAPKKGNIEAYLLWSNMIFYSSSLTTSWWRTSLAYYLDCGSNWKLRGGREWKEEEENIVASLSRFPSEAIWEKLLATRQLLRRTLFSCELFCVFLSTSGLFFSLVL